MVIERNLGFEHKDVSAAKYGYDIESHVPEVLARGSHCLASLRSRVVPKSDSVTVTKNEILTAL